MSKSNSSTRSNSMETPADASEGEVGSPQSNVPAAIMEAAEGQDVVPSSPPPSYEYVLEEDKSIAQAPRLEVTSSRRPQGRELLRGPSRDRQRCVISEHHDFSKIGQKQKQHRSQHRPLRNSQKHIPPVGVGSTHPNPQPSAPQTRLKAQADAPSPVNPIKGPEIMHKSSKELYKAVAKQFGITCKMSDQCRCFDCQSHYFDCEYDQNEHEKTDGGLGAGTPMFISEVMHGTACCIL